MTKFGSLVYVDYEFGFVLLYILERCQIINATFRNKGYLHIYFL